MINFMRNNQSGREKKRKKLIRKEWKKLLRKSIKLNKYQKLIKRKIRNWLKNKEILLNEWNQSN